MVSDFIIASLLILFVCLGIRRGIAKTGLRILGVIAASALSYFLADVFSELIFNAFIRPEALGKLESAISASGIDTAVQESFSALPDWAYSLTSGVFSLFGGSTDSAVNSFLQSAADASVTAETITDGLIAPCVTAILSVIIFLILFVILMFFVRRIIKRLLGIFEFPILKQFNKFFGALLGALEGIILVFFLVNLFAVLISVTDFQPTSPELIFGRLFDFFCVYGGSWDRF